MMKSLKSNLKQIGDRIVLGISLIVFVSLTFLAVQPPSYADSYSENLKSDEQIDRAYDGFGEDAGIQEDIYQERLREGQDPEKMPKPFKRIQSLQDGKEVPETSALETTVSRAKELIQEVTGSK